jgi:hypothetical protein
MNCAQSIVEFIEVTLNYSHYNVIVCVYFQFELNVDLNKIWITSNSTSSSTPS